MNDKRQSWWGVPLGIFLVAVLAGGVMPASVQAKPGEDVVVFGGHPRLGVRISDVTPERMAELKLSAESGVVVEDVEEDSPAAKAGLQKNDVILAFAGERVRSAAQLRRLVEETPAGRKVSLEVSRGGESRAVEVTLPEQTFFRHGEIRVPRIEIPHIEIPHIEIPDIQVFARGPRLGVSADELTPQLAEYFGVKQGKGILVREVMAGSAAAKAGLKAGDVIVRVEDEAIADVGDLRQALAQREGKQVTLGIVRDRREQTIKVELEEAPAASPRRTAALDLECLGGDELHHLTAGARAEAAGMQAELQKLQQELHQQWQEEQRHWQQQWKQESGQLKQEMEKVRQELQRLDVI